MAQGAAVMVWHQMKREVVVHTRRTETVFVTAGKPELIKGEMLKLASIVTNIGSNHIASDEGRSRVVGDCDDEMSFGK